MNLVWVGPDVVEFLIRLSRRHKQGLDRRKLTLGMKLLHKVQHRVGAFFIGICLCIRSLGHKVADIFVLLCPDAADAVDGLIAAVAGGDDIVSFVYGFPGALWAPGIRCKKDLSLYMFWWLDAGDFQRRRRDVDCTDEVVAELPGFEFAGPANNQRDMDAAVVKPLLAADVAAAVVAYENDYGIVRQALVIEAF